MSLLMSALFRLLFLGLVVVLEDCPFACLYLSVSISPGRNGGAVGRLPVPARIKR